MPRVNLRDYQPHPKSRWRCPCGYEGNWDEFRGHRKGYKNREECHGKGVKVWEPELDAEGRIVTETPKQADSETQEASQIQTPELGLPQSPPESELTSEDRIPLRVYEYLGTEDAESLPAPHEDPEIIARRLSEQLNLSAPEDIGGNGHHELIEGDFVEQPAVGPPSLSPVKQTIEVPPVILVWYNWARDQGWFQGDGTISAFVTDCLLDHFRHCWGYRIVVVSEEEVSIIEQNRS